MSFKTRLATRIACAVLIAAASAACSNSDKANSPSTPSGISPRILSVTPGTLQPSTSSQTITVQGDTFVSGLSLEVISPGGNSVVVNGNGIQGLVSNAFQADVVFDVSGNYTLIVRNANGAQSDGFMVQVGSATNTAPEVTSISPGTVVKGPQSVLIVLQGRNLSSDLTITMTPPSGISVVLSGNQVVAVTSTEVDLNLVLNAAGNYTFTLTNGLGQSTSPMSVVAL